jgi:Fe-S-cluster containining protein
MKRHLPVIVERALAGVHALRVEIAGSFASSLTEFSTEEGSGISCRKGCSNCCYHPFTISALEGIALYRWLASHGRWTPSLKESCQRHSKQVWGLTPEIWLLAMVPCPLLSEDTCIAYDSRPFRCRITTSIDNPDGCHPHNLGSAAGILPCTDFSDDFSKRETALMRGVGLQRLVLPLSTAVLFGERFVSGDLDTDSLDQDMMLMFEEIVR